MEMKTKRDRWLMAEAAGDRGVFMIKKNEYNGVEFCRFLLQLPNA